MLSAIILLVLMGMLALTVDVGAMLFRRRAMVNAADASALSAAITCATTNDLDDPQEAADELAMPNSVGLTADDGGIVASQNCDMGEDGWVTVHYSQDQLLFFSPALGFGPTTRVDSRATATWGAAGSTEGAMPLVVSAGAFQGPCAIPDVEEGTRCSLWYDNDLFTTSSFGFLDLRQDIGWDVGPDAGGGCQEGGGAVGARQLMDWISGADEVGKLSLNWPQATYVCTVPGLRGGNARAVWGEVEKLEGQERDFPVNGHAPGPPPGDPIFKNGVLYKYNIIGWVRLRIVDVLTPKESATTCRVNLTAPSVNLIEAGVAQGCVGISSIADVAAVKSVTPGSIKAEDWELDQATGNVFTLKVPVPNNGYTVTFSYYLPDSQCGVAPNGSAACLITEWVGPTFDAEDPGGGGNFGIQKVWLTE